MKTAGCLPIKYQQAALRLLDSMDLNELGFHAGMAMLMISEKTNAPIFHVYASMLAQVRRATEVASLAQSRKNNWLGSDHALDSVSEIPKRP